VVNFISVVNIIDHFSVASVAGFICVYSCLFVVNIIDYLSAFSACSAVSPGSSTMRIRRGIFLLPRRRPSRRQSPS